MTWTNDDGGHEGWAGALFADDWVGGSWVNGGVEASWAPDGTFRWKERSWRPDSEVIGWVPACECGWRGEKVTRVADPALADLAKRMAYSKDAFCPEVVEDELIHPQWMAHVNALSWQSTLQEAHAQHRRTADALDAAVAQARAVGASWADIGRVVGMTRQSANERWSRRIDTITAGGVS